ncbi:MAG: hypothetical protein HY824_12285 [Acidobacteria bacterium]|nr:hypothetical protein [Acidobacteriota bacterium]
MGIVRLAVSAAAALLLAGAGASAQTPVDVSRLPIDLQRIHRHLRLSTVRQAREGLRLRYFVDVYGEAPPLVVFGPDANLTSGPVPYGGPTHREMLEQMTPREFRAPAADFSALVRWLAERANKK